MKLTFGTYDKHDTLVTEFTTYRECWNAINKYLENNNYRSDGYRRTVGLSDKETMIDFGSWTKFFFIDASFEEFRALQEEEARLRGEDLNRGRKYIMTNTDRFKQITNEMADTYEKKNHDYGNSFENTLNKWGYQIGLARLDDKLSRAALLMHDDAKVKEESIEDTLKDLATYAIMLLMWKEKQNENRNS